MESTRAATNGAVSRFRLRGDVAHGPSLLCVEDNDDTRMLLFELLSGEGYEVTTAATVGDGLEALEDTGGFALIITDYSLPDGTGISMLETARIRGHIGAETPVLLFTGEPALEPVEGITLLSKPLQPRIFLRTVRELIESPVPSRESAASTTAGDSRL